MNVVSDEGHPLSVLLHEDVDKVLDVYLPLVVLRIRTIPVITDLVVADVVNAKHAPLLQVPLDELGAEEVVGARLDGYI